MSRPGYPTRTYFRPCVAVAIVALGLGDAGAVDYVPLPGGQFTSVLGGEGTPVAVHVAPFAMRVVPVTHAEFLQFVLTHPRWARGAAPASLADSGYLSGWAAPTAVGPPAAQARPVTNVSWFAAEAYCDAEGARLPTWYEWEYAAAADETRADARADPAWRAKILAWYGRPAPSAPAAVGGPPNAYGIRDLHGLVWEWVDDYNALLVNVDSRTQSDGQKLKFCGEGAITMRDRDHYAVLMRVALLSSLSGHDTSNTLGFRCVRPLPGDSR
jgi:formylglycine-generating enzyme